MPIDVAYREAYPRAGDVALLCEGDVIGYETKILQKWTTQKLRNEPMVDIWPCGTKGAIFGISDAIGRSRPLMVIEDRDFSTEEEATSDCTTSKSNRERRDVRVIDWRTWQRNEIENYLLEPDVLLEVMADAFGCAPQDVQTGLSELIPTLAVYQATQYALYRARRTWTQSDSSRVLPSNVDCRPKWDDTSCRATAPDRNAVRNSLENNLNRWQKRFVSAGDPKEVLQDQALISDFDAKCEEWQRVDWDSPTWRIDWAGKEVLQWLRRWLTSKYGWWDSTAEARVKIEWNRFNQAQRDAKDREIEAGLRPYLTERLVAYISDLTVGKIYDEWQGIEDGLRTYNHHT